MSKWFWAGVLGCILVMGSLLIATSAPVAEWPKAPEGTPISAEDAQPCGPVGGKLIGYYAIEYDLDPRNDKAFLAEYYVFDGETVGKKVLVIYGDGKTVTAYFELPGRGVQAVSIEKLKALYSHPCQLILQVAGSPSV